MSDIILYGEIRCHKTRYYQAALEERELSYEIAEVDKNPEAARRLTELTGSPTKFPTLEIKGRKVRNPTLPVLDRELARAGLYDPGLVHDERSRRFIRHMAPSDAFVSYIWQGDRMVLTHIEIDPGLRGRGLGARLAAEVFAALNDRPHEIRLTCPFLRRVGLSRPQWREKFALGIKEKA